MQFEIQLTAVEVAIPISRDEFGYISALTVHGTGPIPGANVAKYSIIPNTGIHEAFVCGQNSSDQKTVEFIV